MCVCVCVCVCVCNSKEGRQENIKTQGERKWRLYKDYKMMPKKVRLEGMIRRGREGRRRKIGGE